MDLIEQYYDKRPFAMYGLFVVVPGTSRYLRIFFNFIGAVTLKLAVVFQVAKCVSDGFHLEIIIDLMPTIIAGFGCFVYIIYVVNTTTEDYAVLLAMLSDDLKQERSAEELAIKKQYARNAQLFINIYTVLMSVTFCGMSLSGFVPQLLDIVFPLNETRERQLLFDVEIFADQKKYFYYVYVLECYAVLVVCVLVGVSENMFVIFVQHISGMFAVIGHRLNNMTVIDDRSLKDSIDAKQIITRRLHVCIKDHQTTLKFAELIDTFYNFPITLTLVSTFCALTVSLVQVTDPQLITMKMVLFTTTQIVQLFIISCMGQNLINVSEEIFNDTYAAKWYVCSPDLQKILQLMILKSSKPCEIVPGKIYTLSVESFLQVIQTVVSCFMVLRQSR